MADVIAIKEGGDLDLSCPIILWQDDMIISWTCDNEPANIKSSRIHITDSGKLRIKSAKVGDSCNYRCEVADGFGTISVIIKVIIVDKRLMEQLSRHNQTSNYPTQLNKNSTSINSQGLTSEVDNSEQLETVGQNKSAQNDYQNTFQVTISPESVHIGKNQTFSLECRAKFPQHLMAPQIIWLKEFIGRRPDSINEAHDRNLVVIENVFYHSLNWPRSITYTKKSSSANSALLMRQTNFAHSGRYICFAGYPPHIMSSNFTSSADTNSSSSSSSGEMSQQKKFKYKWAIAEVRVDDPEGEENHRLNLESTAVSEEWNQGLKQKNLLFSVFATNTWTRNLTAGIMILCGILYAAKLIFLKFRKSKNANKDDTATGIAETGNLMREPTENDISLRGSGTIAIKKLQSNNFYHKQDQSGPHSTGVIESNTNTNSIKSRQDCPNTIEINLSNDQDTAVDDESNHFYSEIGNKYSESAADSIYKIPSRKINIDH